MCAKRFVIWFSYQIFVDTGRIIGETRGERNEALGWAQGPATAGGAAIYLGITTRIGKFAVAALP